MNRIFSDAKDLYVETTLVYLNEDDGCIYWDEAFTKGVTMAEAADLFFKGMTIVKDNKDFYIPVTMEKTDKVFLATYCYQGTQIAVTTIDSEEPAGPQ